ERQVDRAEPPPDVAEERRIRGVAGEKYARFSQNQNESAPQRAISIQRAPCGEVVCGRERDRQRRSLCVLPPIELFDAADASRSRESSVPQRCHDSRIEMFGELSDRAQIAVIVMVVTEQHDRDGRQLLEPYRRL